MLRYYSVLVQLLNNTGNILIYNSTPSQPLKWTTESK